MRDVASGVSGKTNKKVNGNGGSDDKHNKNRNSCHPDKSGDQYSTVKFKGKVEGLFNLGMKNFWDFIWK